MSDVPAPRLPISQFEYQLPSELIAQKPMEPRDSSKLLVVPRDGTAFEDRVFRDLPTILAPGDVLVLNDTRVIPARLFAQRATGGRVQILLLSRDREDVWHAIARPARKLRTGDRLCILDREGVARSTRIEVTGREPDGQVLIRIDDSDATIHAFGQMPLPPYIGGQLEDPERYQTVYSNQEGSAAAPTAGLHFTADLLERCRARGIDILYVTLHVGLDTFQPVKVDDALDHRIHSEWFQVDGHTMNALRDSKRAGKRILAVGTTAARTLESIAPRLDDAEPQQGVTSIYITPGYRFQLVDGMITNFHLPRTTLLLMVSALAGNETIRQAYEYAIQARYRFYSFGDAMLIV